MEFNFVRITVDRATETILQDEIPHFEDMVEWWDNLVDLGYKTSRSYNKEKGSYIYSLTGKESKHNKGLVCSQWGGSKESALRKVYIIHELLCKDDNWGLAESKMDELLRQLMGRT